MSYQQPPQHPQGQYPPQQGQYPPPPGGQYPPQQGGQYPPPQYPPQQGQYPPDQFPPQGQPTQKRGCRGCLMGCLVATLVVAALLVVAVIAGVYVVKQMFPTTESATQAASCAIMRIVVNNAETGIQQSDASEAEKADMRRGVEDLRREFDQQCGPVR